VLQAVRDSRLGPPIVARALAIVHTCIYDAWAAYDRVAVGTRLGGSLRQAPGLRTLPNQVEALSFAACDAAVDLFPTARLRLFDPLMADLGYDPTEATGEPESPAHVGTVACDAVLAFRHHDGANQLGDEPSGTPGSPYSDYTGYHPVNEPMDLSQPFQPSTVHDPDRWQPLQFIDGQGQQLTQTFTTPQWSRVTRFAMPTGGSLRSPHQGRRDTGPRRTSTKRSTCCTSAHT